MKCSWQKPVLNFPLEYAWNLKLSYKFRRKIRFSILHKQTILSLSLDLESSIYCQYSTCLSKSVHTKRRRGNISTCINTHLSLSSSLLPSFTGWIETLQKNGVNINNGDTHTHTRGRMMMLTYQWKIIRIRAFWYYVRTCTYACVLFVCDTFHQP
jgi:hypothetical protein